MIKRRFDISSPQPTRLCNRYGMLTPREFPSTKHTPRGLSLLEVILALSILAVSSAYLAQSMQLATHNALRAERLTQAELVAESVMNQVIAGVIPAQSVQWTNYQNSTGNTDWFYQLQNVSTEVEGMVGLQVAVQKVDPVIGLVQSQYDLFANRWMIDPSLELDIPPEESADESTSSSTGGEQSGSSAAANSASGAGGYGGGDMGGFGGDMGGFGGGVGGFGGGVGGGMGGGTGPAGRGPGANAGGGRGSDSGPGAGGGGGGRGGSPRSGGGGGGRSSAGGGGGGGFGPGGPNGQSAGNAGRGGR